MEKKRKYAMTIFMAVIGAFGILGVIIADTQSRSYSFLGYLLGSFFGCFILILCFRLFDADNFKSNIKEIIRAELFLFSGYILDFLFSHC